jgi:hypothetical protein
MSKLRCRVSISPDGFVAGTRARRTRWAGWYFREVPTVTDSVGIAEAEASRAQPQTAQQMSTRLQGKVSVVAGRSGSMGVHRLSPLPARARPSRAPRGLPEGQPRAE